MEDAPGRIVVTSRRSFMSSSDFSLLEVDRKRDFATRSFEDKMVISIGITSKNDRRRLTFVMIVSDNRRCRPRPGLLLIYLLCVPLALVRNAIAIRQCRGHRGDSAWR